MFVLERKIIKIYNNWTEANSANEFCIDDNSCYDILATCQFGPTGSTTKFCKCPPGYRIQDENRRCGK